MSNLLLETGDVCLMETGDKLLLDEQSTGTGCTGVAGSRSGAIVS